MGLAPDDSYYGGQTVTGAGWPNVDEDLLERTAGEFDNLEAFIRDTVVPSANSQWMNLSDWWEGTGAQAALDEARGIITDHEANESAAKATSGDLMVMFTAVKLAKSLANITARETQQACENIMNEVPPEDSEDDRSARAAGKVAEGYNENVRVVSKGAKWLAEQLGVAAGTPGADGKVPASSQDPPNVDEGQGNTPSSGGLDEAPQLGLPPLTVPKSFGGQGNTLSSGGVSGTPQPRSSAPAVPKPSYGQESVPSTGALGQARQPEPQTAASASSPSNGRAAPSAGSLGSSSPGSAPSTGGASQGPQISPTSSGGSKSEAASSAKTPGTTANPAGAGAKPTTPLEQFQKGMADGAKTGGSPQSSAPPPSQPLGAPATTQPLGAQAPVQGPPTAPPSAAITQAAGSAGMPGAGSVPVGAGPSAGGPSGTPMPLGPPPTAPPAGPTAPPAGAVAGGAPVVAPAGAASGGAQVAPIPVSAQRAERDAVARALRPSGTDPLEVARRIAAALNAAPSIPKLPWKFGWAVGMTVEATLVVANTYGLGYIPKGVNLPDGVQMVSADESIPPADRAKWVGYPYVALQGWVQHHDQRLRAVFGTEEQLQGVDPGAAKIVLTPADIPDNGTMQGRSRLEVIAPDVAARLASAPDAGLTDLLPVRPADDTPPEDQADQLWFNMIKPLMRKGSSTGTAHLEAFVTYANHEYELALHRAHTAGDAVVQRSAIADWIYWQHVSVLISDALGSQVTA